MSDEQTLLAVIAAIYLADCIFWIPRHGLGFTNWAERLWQLRAPSVFLGNERGAPGFANPLPPLGLASRAVGWTISLSEHGIFPAINTAINPGVRRVENGTFITWPEIQKIEREDKNILINGKHFATAVSEYSARWMAREIARLQKIPDKRRASEIEAMLGASYAVGEVTKRVAEFQKQTRTLRYLANWLFIFLFGACPYLVWQVGIVKALWPIVIGIYAQTILIALLFWNLHRKIYPADSAQILKPFLTMLLAAPSAIRAQDILGRPLLETFHPLVAARALCSEAEFEQLAPVVFRDLHFPRFPLVANETETVFRNILLKWLRRATSLDDSKFLKPPEKSEAVHTSYCQRCLQQFTEVATSCPDCGGRPLVKF